MANVLSPHALAYVMTLLVAVLGCVTLVLYYHWLRYGFGDHMVILAQVLYTFVLLAGLIIMVSTLSSL